MRRHPAISYSIFAWLGLFLLGLSSLPRKAPVILYNPSPSAKIGWYRIATVLAYERGDLVAAWLPEAASIVATERSYLPPDVPIIKTILAVPGDAVCRKGEYILLPEPPSLQVRPADRQGRSLPSPFDGCRHLGSDEYFIGSSRIRDSFDSRYFGPVGEKEIIGLAVFLGSDEVELTPEQQVIGRGAGFGRGVQDKRDRAVPPLTHCLHVIFYSALQKTAALQSVSFRKNISALVRRCLESHIWEHYLDAP